MAEEMPQSFREQLAARMTRPSLLDPRAIDAVLALPFKPRGERGARAYFGDDEEAYTLDRDGVAMVSIDGPLAQRAWSCWMFGGDGYDAIVDRCRSALANPKTSALVLKIDSPGGEVAGCFDAVRTIRALGERAGVPIVAYADELAASAAYALACAAEAIVLPDSGCVGSIGVITTVIDQTAALEQRGLKVHVIASGARKADGHGAIPLGDEARAAIQGEIDYLARDVFAPEVAQARGLSVEQVMGLEAACFLGPQAVDAGLADRVGNLSSAVEMARELATTRRSNKKMEKLKGQLGLAADATDEQVEAEVSAQLAMAKVGASLGASADEAAGKLAALREEAAAAPALREQLAAEKARGDSLEKARLLDAAVREGKLTRDDVEGKTDRLGALLGGKVADASVERVKGLLGGLRAQGVHVNPAPQPGATQHGALTDEEKAEAKRLGISEAAMLAAKTQTAAKPASIEE
jgi:signal peptide peptidase SppA